MDWGVAWPPKLGARPELVWAAAPIGIATLILWFLVGRWQALALFLIAYALVVSASELVRRRLPPEQRYAYLKQDKSRRSGGQ